MFDLNTAHRRREQRAIDVELVSMPWTSLNEPSLGLGILSAVLAEAGLSATVRHLNLQLLRYLRPATYRALAESFALNDFLFSGVPDPTSTTRQRGWLHTKASGLVTSGQLARAPGGGSPSVDEVTVTLLDLRARVIPAWLEEQADLLARSPAPLVGFTCMFDQTIASVALAQLVKQRCPEKLVALGGYAVREPTASAVLRAFGWVDVVCTGEGEPVIVPLARAAAGECALSEVPSIVHRGPGRDDLRSTPPAPLVDLAHSPTPDYDDFHVDVADLSARERVDIAVTRLPVENSRGCWWGQIRHCVFCGIHDDDLRYRTKPAPVALRTMEDLAGRYGVAAFRFSDYILPRIYFTTLLPELADRGAPWALTAEMKANVDDDQFALLVSAGFVELQPGIESFSGRALRSMDKGTSPAQNARTLMMGRRHGVRVHWNLLYGFPDDDPDDYEQMLETLSRLIHLDPPATRLPVQVTRYAPLQVDPGRFGIPTASYDPSYDLVFSREFLDRSGFDLGEYCYYFARPFQNSVRLSGIYRRIDDLIDLWKAVATQRRPSLSWRRESGAVLVSDNRWDPRGVETVLDAASGTVLQALARSRTLGRLAGQTGLTPQQIRRAIAVLDRLRLVIRDGERWLSVVLPPTGEPEPPELRDADERNTPALLTLVGPASPPS
jgi:ribosomal peptide maturation radical SAM protein 1